MIKARVPLAMHVPTSADTIVMTFMRNVRNDGAKATASDTIAVQKMASEWQAARKAAIAGLTEYNAIVAAANRVASAYVGRISVKTVKRGFIDYCFSA